MSGMILIVDSSAELRSLFARVLESQGFETAQARDAEAALKFLAEKPKPDLVLLDSEMESMSGADFLAELERRNPKIFVGMPIIALSGANIFSHPKVKRSMRKPLDLCQLEAAVSSVVLGHNIRA